LFINGQARSSGNEAMQVYSHEGWGGYVVLHIKAATENDAATGKKMAPIVMASAPNGYFTSPVWKCQAGFDEAWLDPNFDDALWPPAAEYGTNKDKTFGHFAGVSEDAQWIGAPANIGIGGDVSCRAPVGTLEVSWMDNVPVEVASQCIAQCSAEDQGKMMGNCLGCCVCGHDPSFCGQVPCATDTEGSAELVGGAATAGLKMKSHQSDDAPTEWANGRNQNDGEHIPFLDGLSTEKAQVCIEKCGKTAEACLVSCKRDMGGSVVR